MSNVFAFRPGHSIRGVDPQQVGEELERIRSTSGELTPAHVVEAARSEDSPLHSAFEWDDTQAAQNYRLAQARRVLGSVRVVNGPTQTIVPAFVSVRKPEKGRTWIPTVDAMSDEQLRARVLDDIRQFIESLERRYAHFAEVASVLANVKQAVG